MTQPGPTAAPTARSGLVVSLAVGGLALAGILGSLLAGDGLAEAGGDVLRAGWLLPGLVGLHLGQLLMSAVAWRGLFTAPRSSLAQFYQLRIIREGIDSLLPVAQVGGEIVGAQLLARRGVPLGAAAASVVVDVTVEFLTQVAFLVAGVAVLSWLSGVSGWTAWAEGLATAFAALAALALAQRFGLLRALEGLARGIARRWPGIGVSLDGLHAAALGFYRNGPAMRRSAGLHGLAWVLGSLETWAVLQALDVPVTPLQAFTVESLGMAARSAGFAIPGALGAQEGGFVLAAAAVGLPVAPGFALSLVKRLREVLVGAIGLGLWRAEARRAD